MKENSLKILTWLYSDNLQQPLLSSYEQLQLVVPRLTRGGLRSMIKYLSDQQLVKTEITNQQTLVRITSYGIAELERQFPVFWHRAHHWQGKWSCLVFLTAPSTDPAFRYLRTVLLGEKAMQLSRGVYLYPGEFPEKVRQVCRELYLGAITIFSIDQWQFGDERSTIVNSFSLSAVVETYSGISKSINQLLSVKIAQKSSYPTLKKEIFSVFDRLYVALSRDSGLAMYYFGNAHNPIQLLQHLQQLTTSLLLG